MPKGPTRRLLLVASLSASFMAALPAGAQTVAGTAYDKLDLSAPEAALRTFLTAYRQGDFVTAFWVLSPQSQAAWLEAVYRFDLPRLVRGTTKELMPHLERLMPALDRWEQQDVSFLFANVMTVGKELGRLPLDLDGLSADLSPAAMPKLGTASEAGDGRIDVAVALKAYPAPVIFRMELSPLRKWRLRQVIPPGADEGSIPWGLRAG